MFVPGKFIHIALLASLALQLPHAAAAESQEVVERLSTSVVRLYDVPRGKVIAELQKSAYPTTLSWKLLQPKFVDSAFFNVSTPVGDGWVKKNEVRLGGTASQAVTAGGIAEDKGVAVGGTRAIGDADRVKKP